MAEKIVRQQQIEYKGVKIIHSDYRNVEGEALIDVVRRNTADSMRLVNQGEKDLLVINDFRGLRLPGSVYSKIRNAAIELGPHIKARALVGITGPRKAMVKAVSVWLDHEVKVFDNVEDAKEWLVKIAKK